MNSGRVENEYILDPAKIESVKIQGYDVIPTTRSAAGKFTTYKGTSLMVTVPSSLFYIVHFDIVKCMPIVVAVN
jgi:hypothetical protein